MQSFFRYLEQGSFQCINPATSLLHHTHTHGLHDFFFLWTLNWVVFSPGYVLYLQQTRHQTFQSDSEVQLIGMSASNLPNVTGLELLTTSCVTAVMSLLSDEYICFLAEWGYLKGHSISNWYFSICQMLHTCFHVCSFTVACTWESLSYGWVLCCILYSRECNRKSQDATRWEGTSKMVKGRRCARKLSPIKTPKRRCAHRFTYLWQK